MKHPARILRRAVALAAGASLCAPLLLLAQAQNSAQPTIPTLGGAGIASLVGAISMGGAWLLSRRRDRRK